MPLPIRNDIDFHIYGFRDSRAASGSYLNAATTKTWEIRSNTVANSGAIVTSGTLEYVTGSNGEYVGGPDDAAALVEGTTYWGHIVLDQGGVHLDIEWPIPGARRLGTSPNG